MGALVRRIAVTVAVLAVVVLLTRIPLPGVDTELLEMYGLSVGIVSVGVLGATPWVTAHVLVELCCFLTPRLRALRLQPERPGIDRAVRLVWLGVCLVQGYSLMVGMQAMRVGAGSLLVADGQGQLAFMASVVGGSALVGIGAQVLSRFGLGARFAPLVLLKAALDLLSEPTIPGLTPTVSSDQAFELVLYAALVAGATVALLRSRGLTGLPLAVAGSIPAAWTTVLFGVAPLAVWNVPTVSILSFGSVAFLLAIAVGWLLHRPAVLAGALGQPVERVAADVRRGLLLNGGFAFLLIAASVASSSSPVPLEAVGLALLTALVWDLVEEAAARRRDLVSAGLLHRPFEVAPALTALAAEGIDAHARGLRFRQLTHFFGPYAPIDVLVPPGQAEAARRVLWQRISSP